MYMFVLYGVHDHCLRIPSPAIVPNGIWRYNEINRAIPEETLLPITCVHLRLCKCLFIPYYVVRTPSPALGVKQYWTL